MRREFEVVQRALQRAESKVKLNVTWRRIHEETGIGDLVGASLVLSHGDRAQLRDWLNRKTGVDPLSKEKLGATRMDLAQQGRDEKLAMEPVFGGMIKVARADGTALKLTAGPAIVPPGSLLNVESEALIVAQEPVVIVENGAAMRNWQEINLPDHIKSAILIYRGHGGDAQHVLNLLKGGGAACRVGFFDFDPAGLQMGLTLPIDGLLIPADWPALTADANWVRDYNKPESFWHQGVALQYLKQHAPASLTTLIQHIELNQLAITQEHIIKHRIPLQLISLI
ncbi:DUF7281 domain-containing protein [Marinobacterium stanieri]|uniref:DUF7281 domain-containing protein n=1 Tax=Marinobacterium stanieri TaxID=49186 RepID=A0A1N6XBP2_9GAMM|nr:hypothetical protein [Marinobacterium stanieri]SIQ99669.1 hypothetical protein SAMN05421647_11366 [Marinobacterium stanieri]